MGTKQRFCQPHELDALLGYPRGRSARLARRGLLPYVQLPDGEVRFDNETIERWLREHTIGTTQEVDNAAK